MKHVITIWGLPCGNENEEYNYYGLQEIIQTCILHEECHVNKPSDIVVVVSKDKVIRSESKNDIFFRIDFVEQLHVRMLMAVLQAIKHLYPSSYVQGRFTYPGGYLDRCLE